MLEEAFPVVRPFRDRGVFAFAYMLYSLQTIVFFTCGHVKAAPQRRDGFPDRA
jgi:hypothetical protein